MTLREDTLFELVEITYCPEYTVDKQDVQNYDDGKSKQWIAQVRVDNRKVQIYRLNIDNEGDKMFAVFEGEKMRRLNNATRISGNNLSQVVDECINYLIAYVRP